MAANDLTHFFPATVALLLLLLLTPPQLAVAAPAPPPVRGCSDELVSFSPCLPYISAPPNNGSASPSTQCCDVFSSTVDSGDGECLCYLVSQPLFFGFPLNSTRLFSLSSICPLNNTRSGDDDDSLQSICSDSGTLTLPPLHSIVGPEIRNHHDSGYNNSSPFSFTSPPESADGSPTKPSPLPAPASPSYAVEGNNNSYSWFSLGMMVLLVLTFISH